MAVAKTNTRIKFTIPKETYERLQELAKVQHRSLSELVMHYCINGIDRDLSRESVNEKMKRVLGNRHAGGFFPNPRKDHSP